MVRTLKRVRGTARKHVGHSAAGRCVSVRRDDTFLVSYPKSGNTWLRFLVGNLFDPSTPVDFLDIERRAPDIYVNSDRTLRRLPDPRFLKSHEYFDPRYGRVLYVVRDPRDVVVSYYRYQVKVDDFGETYSGTRYLQAFLDGKLDQFGSWQTNVGSWVGARSCDDSFCLLRYEDMSASPMRIARELCDFLRLLRSDDEIRTALARSDRERMQELERRQNTQSILLRGTRGDLSFIGKGMESEPVDESDQYLRSSDARQRIENRFGGTMKTLGYA